jgi:hypothetical protein
MWDRFKQKKDDDSIMCSRVVLVHVLSFACYWAYACHVRPCSAGARFTDIHEKLKNLNKAILTLSLSIISWKIKKFSGICTINGYIWDLLFLETASILFFSFRSEYSRGERRYIYDLSRQSSFVLASFFWRCMTCHKSTFVHVYCCA